MTEGQDQVEISVATSEEDFAALEQLVREYWQWLQARYVDADGLMDRIAGYQALDAELADLRSRYGPPRGRALLARRGEELSGCVAYRDLGEGACEMKRLYVPASFAGSGLGRRLCRELISLATADGFKTMKLDTGFRNTEALAMYASMGFVPCPPYLEYPPDVLPHLRFRELSLS